MNIKNTKEMIRIITVYDNTVYDNIEHRHDFKSDWGFGCIIDHPNGRFIFDTGAKPEILEENLKRAEIDPISIDVIVLSHKHWDHKGGMCWLAQKNPNLKVYLPKTFSGRIEKELSAYTQNIFPIQQNFSITSNFHLVVSKNFWITELALVISTSEGSLVFTGCSHTGIHKIAQKVRDKTNLNIACLFGGFHLFRASPSKINETIEALKKLDVHRIAPCHCTGKNATALLRSKYQQNFLENGVGAEFKVPV